MLRRASLLGLFALAGCGPNPTPPPPPDAGPPHCTTGFLGDKTKAPEVQVIALGAGNVPSAVKDGDMVALLFPPQGGRVIFAGVRATNLDACGVQLGGALRDETTKQVRLDSRTVNLIPTGDGWAASDPANISTFANVPVCPNQWSKTDLFGTEYQLELTVADRAGRMGALSVKVTPECAEPSRAAECLCICEGGYMLGESCADAGAGDGGAGDAGDGGDGGG